MLLESKTCQLQTSLWHVNYLKKKKKKDQGPKDSGGNSDLLHNCLKEFLQRAYSWNRASTRDILKEHDLGAWVNSRYYLVSKLCPTLLLPP